MKPSKQYGQKIFHLLKSHYPDAKMILKWSNNWELLVAIILSAQCTDKKVNEVTEKLFSKYKLERHELEREYEKYSGMHIPNNMLTELINMTFVPIKELEQDIRSAGFYHNKAKNIQAAAKVVLDRYHGALHRSIKELILIPGVGRKTANVFLGNAYQIYEGIAVDTHVTKQSQRLGLTSQKDPDKIEKDLMELFPQQHWFQLTYLLIEHGRNMRRKKSDRKICGKSNCLLCDTNTQQTKRVEI